MAKPMRAAGLWNPKAIRVMTLILEAYSRHPVEVQSNNG